MNIIDFSRLFRRRAPHTLPVLIELRHPDRVSFYFTNNSRDVTWQGARYRATTLEWTPPSSTDGIPQGGTLEITVNEHANDMELLRWFDEADDRAEIVVNGVIQEGGRISELDVVIQRHGTASWNGKTITWNPTPDDRFGMHLSPWTLDSEALHA